MTSPFELLAAFIAGAKVQAWVEYLRLDEEDLERRIEWEWFKAFDPYWNGRWKSGEARA